MTSLKLSAALLPLLCVVGCARLPDRVEAVEQARAAITEAESDPLSGRVNRLVSVAAFRPRSDSLVLMIG